MLAGNLIWADRLSLDREKNLFVATGHVLVVSTHQVLGGDEVIYNSSTEDFFLKNAFVVTEDPKRVDDIGHRVLGITPQEVAFEIDKGRQLQILNDKKAALKKRYSEVAGSQKPLVVNEYASVLEREELIAKQKNPILAQAGAEKRETIERRREFWEQSKKGHLPIAQPLIAGAYVRLEGAWIERTEGNHYRATQMAITPCFCDDDEKPAWGIRADTFDAYGEGYADFSDAVIEIKGIPILYFPFLRVPMKGQRQSGFLFPSLSYTHFNGSILSQPIFFDLGPDKDSTVTLDLIEKRGIRFGGELRYQAKKYSGWTLSGEAIRDSQWLMLQDQRADIARSYSDGLAQAVATLNHQPLPPARETEYSSPSLSSPQYWNSIGFSYCLTNPTLPECRGIIDAYIRSPNNTWRNKLEWKGMSFLTPRLSLVSEGKILSDHRYLQDLYFETYNESFNPAQPALFSKTKGHIHLDGNDFYGGIGSSWGDQMTSDNRFSGHQIPAYMRLRTRFFTLLEEPKPIYAGLLFNYKKIDFFDDDSFDEPFPSNNLNVRLNSGNWAQAKMNVLVPLITDQVFVVNYFTELEARAIETGYRYSQTTLPTVDIGEKTDPFNTIRTARLGLEFNLPIDGTRQMSSNDADKTEGLQFLTHRMNWGLTYSWRPSVVRKGGYGDIFNAYALPTGATQFEPLVNSQALTYFASESPENFDSDYLPEMERMISHQIVLLNTSHDWLTFKRSWQDMNPPPHLAESQDFKAIAREELNYAQYLTESLRGTVSDYDAKKKGFRILESDQKTFLHVDSSISYDFRKEAERENMSEDPTELPGDLPQAWSPWRTNLSLNLREWTMSTFAKYDLYAKVISELRFSFSPPTVFATKLTFGYSIEKEISYDGFGGLLLNRTLTRSYGLNTTIIPRITLLGEYDIRTKENQVPSMQYYASAGAQYFSPSNCWGMQFYWRKDYPETVWTGTYYLSLIVKFFNYNREYGNLLSKVNQNQPLAPQ